MEDFLELLGISERFNSTTLLPTIDYNSIQLIIDKLIIQSKGFIERALDC